MVRPGQQEEVQAGAAGRLEPAGAVDMEHDNAAVVSTEEMEGAHTADYDDDFTPDEIELQQDETDEGEGEGEEDEDEDSDDDSDDDDDGNDDEVVDIPTDQPEAANGAAEIEEVADEGEAEEGGEDHGRPVSIQEYLAWRLLGRMPQRAERADTRSRFRRLEDIVPQALPQGCALAQQLNRDAAGVHARQRCDLSYLDGGVDAALLASRTAPLGQAFKQELWRGTPSAAAAASHCQQQQQLRARQQQQRGAGSASAAAAAGAGGSAAPGPTPAYSSYLPDSAKIPPGFLTGFKVHSSPRLLMYRELGMAGRHGPGGDGFSDAQRCHMGCYRNLPRYPRQVVDAIDSRAYIGQFSDDGQFFVAAFQDRRVRLYDVERGWRLRKDITTRMCRWTITDTSVSPDQRFVIYSSIMPVVHLVEVGSSYDAVESVANITQVHEPLSFDETVPNREGADFRLGRSFGIWSVQWSGDGREIVAGTNDQSVVVLDVETRRVVARAEGHEDDVNAVTYADASPNIIVSGSDDSTIKVWDRRTLSAPPGGPLTRRRSAGAGCTSSGPARPEGVLVGHTEGLTHLHARGDGRHLLSNCKDQSAKLWDLRMMEAGGSLRTPSATSKLSSKNVPHFNWDYRWQEYPAVGREVRHPHDASLMTYRGHGVQHTLIRAYFSPAATTGQRYVYTGSVSGGVHVYDVASGQEVEGSPLTLHRKLVRDVSWHPHRPGVMATVSWDGTVVRWDAAPPGDERERRPEVPAVDAFSDYY